MFINSTYPIVHILSFQIMITVTVTLCIIIVISAIGTAGIRVKAADIILWCNSHKGIFV